MGDLAGRRGFPVKVCGLRPSGDGGAEDGGEERQGADKNAEAVWEFVNSGRPAVK